MNYLNLSEDTTVITRVHLKKTVDSLHKALQNKLKSPHTSSEDLKETYDKIMDIVSKCKNEWFHLFNDPRTSKSQIDEIKTILLQNKNLGGDHMINSGIVYVIMNGMDAFRSKDFSVLCEFEFKTKVIETLHRKKAMELTQEHFRPENIKKDLTQLVRDMNPNINIGDKGMKDYIKVMKQYSPRPNRQIQVSGTEMPCTWGTYCKKYQNLCQSEMTLEEAIADLIKIALGETTNDSIPSQTPLGEE